MPPTARGITIPRVSAYRSINFRSRPTSLQTRAFSASRRVLKNKQTHRKEAFGARLREAWNNTRVEWYAIPAAAGIGFLGALQLYKVVTENEKARREAEEDNGGVYNNGEDEDPKKPKKRKRVRPSGPWQVQIMSTLPLKALSRLWGRFNELTIPYYLRVPGFKLYSYIFGVNLSEVEEPDLHVFPNLAAFFYRTLKPGVRPIDSNPNSVVSPADGKVIQFGTIDNGEVEQVKGMTYSLDALLGSEKPTPVSSGTATPTDSRRSSLSGDEEAIRSHEEFAQVNGISYRLPDLLGDKLHSSAKSSKKGATVDQSMKAKSGSIAEVRADLALSEPSWWSGFSGQPKPAAPTQLYYCVIYLAPGDYHRFHSPVPWVVERRRHFAGELYSVSPYLQRTLPGLFTLNERVVLLGRWRHGFFSYTPVGATNVGSIVVNFDKELRTNSLTTDTAADRAAEQAAARGEQYSGFAEATYENASELLGGHALRRGEEMGGFQLGSTIVLVFEAPKSRRITSFDEGFGDRRKGGWNWKIEKGQKVKVGEAIGEVLEDN
ncbi:phosphatidylserine decarboxylase [Microthyrium microscopicum]|uniref:Phosphatidylserine decarboxylase proenzyme 1, mitochondrial n=1 Tax=Microthyrium microscopicum TaxID=703497 RepID=A0A6A6UK56_9PEZI|nr:phosphatidylserine decarboxylase [Microthyrium microscopicum]